MGFTDSTGRYVPSKKCPIQLPYGQFCLAAGTALAAFADGASPTPGLAVDDSEVAGIRWNNHATPAAVFTELLVPFDRVPNTDMYVHLAVAKTGATVGDATTFTIGAFLKPTGALRDSDANAGGATGAIVGNATSKTIQHVKVKIAAADIPASTMDAPATLMLSIKPTDGLLGTDDITMHVAYVEYAQAFAPDVAQ